MAKQTTSRPVVSWLKPIMTVALIAAVGWILSWSAAGMRIDLDRISRGLPAIGRIVTLMFPSQVDASVARWLWVGVAGAAVLGFVEVRRWKRMPVLSVAVATVLVLYGVVDREWWGVSVSAMGQSFAIALIGTTIGSILAVPLGFWAARNVVAYNFLAALGRQVLNAVRTFPELVLAVFFVAAYGPGPVAGAMAVGLHSVGMLGKLYADVIENIDSGPSEALEAAGANRWQTWVFAVFPQVLPEFVATALYRFEINLRSATTLGLVGAGGIGVILLQALSFRRWSVVGTALLVIVISVTIVDFISARLRQRII